eukprot:TRINITY_DN516_c0_g1_i1.p1 TRINITY_DN516_c0_g1~~TRINITY_DN516_c0_g1_i1.p1  ORF type:complete len:1227 (+),score=207.28 TRINITY_DN516_c0_g1_i1:56-3736(+)
MKTLCLLLLVIVLASSPTYSQQTVIKKEGYCAMYGTCSRRVPSGMINCPANVPAVKPNFDISLCPQFTDLACCDINQYKNLQKNIALTAPIFGRCEACIENFKIFWCEYTCSPNQSLFTDVLDVTTDGALVGRSIVNASSYHISRNYSQAFYDSCSEVKFAATGTTVFSLFGWDRGYEEWFGYMGDPEEYSPYLIKFFYDTVGSASMRCYTCSEPIHACACADCTPSCKVIPFEPEIIEECEITVGDLTTTCLGWGLAFGYMGFLAVIPAIIFVRYRLFRRIKGYTWLDDYQMVLDDEDVAVHGAINTESKKKGVSGYLQERFFQIGVFCTKSPYLVICCGLIFTAVFGAGISVLELETDPVNLWVSDQSTSKQRMDSFDELFTPFYRVAQVIFVDKYTPGVPVVTQRQFQEVMDFQEKVKNITFAYKGMVLSYNDVCNKPVKGYGCIVQSPLAWWQNDPQEYAKYKTDKEVQDKVSVCAVEIASTKCQSEIRAPVDPNVALGGFKNRDYTNATAIVLTYLLDNRPEDESKNEKWEDQFLKFMEVEANNFQYLKVAYSTERSVEDEINRDATSEIPTIVISYIIMLIYVGVALGRLKPLSLATVRSRMLLSFMGVILVILSMVIAVGMWAYVGVKATLIISQVIPFLILSIGLDNMFIIVNTLDSTDPTQPLEQRMGTALSLVGISITAASFSETFSFLLGAMTEMPAVQAFTLYASASIAVSYLLTMTCFVSLLALDTRREKGYRYDCVPCVRKDVDTAELQEAAEADSEEPILRKFIKNYYIPFLYRPWVRLLVIVFFVGLSFASIALIPEIPLGLDQRVALPKDSYLQDYFDYIEIYLQVGSPTYFVVKDLDYSIVENQNKICTLPGCLDRSLGNVINNAKNYPEITYYALSLSNWLDDYLTWLRSENTYCCRRNSVTGEYCASTDLSRQCVPCIDELDENLRPTPEQFNEFVSWFLDSECTDECGICGTAYQVNVALQPDNQTITAVRYMTYHTVLKSQQEFIDALESANDLTDDMVDELDLDMFPYSKFYVFFEQYLTIKDAAIFTTMLAFAAVFVLTLALLRNVWVSFIVVLSMAMIEVDLIGTMYLWDIDMNAVSVVNMVMAVGMSIEFCVHMGTAFCESTGTSVVRSMKALIVMGPNIVLGIALTNCGVLVLGFSNSDIFVIYYFRMYLLIIILGLLHGLLFIPVALTLLPDQLAGVSKEKQTEYIASPYAPYDQLKN